MTIVFYWRSLSAFVFGALYMAFIVSCCEASNHLVEQKDVPVDALIYEQEVVNFLAEASMRQAQNHKVAN